MVVENILSFKVIVPSKSVKIMIFGFSSNVCGYGMSSLWSLLLLFMKIYVEKTRRQIEIVGRTQSS